MHVYMYMYEPMYILLHMSKLCVYIHVLFIVLDWHMYIYIYENKYIYACCHTQCLAI